MERVASEGCQTPDEPGGEDREGRFKTGAEIELVPYRVHTLLCSSKCMKRFMIWQSIPVLFPGADSISA